MGGLKEEYYVMKRGYHLKCDKSLHRGVGVEITVFSSTYFLNDFYHK